MKKEIIEIEVKGTGKGVEQVKKLDDSVKKVDKSTDELKDNTASLGNSLDKMTGGMVSGFKNAVGGVKKGIIAMKSLKIAIAATGVGLLVLAFGALVTFFTKSQKGMDALSVAFAQFGAAVDVIIDRVIAIGEILSNIFNKPLKETLSGISDEFEGIGDEIARDVKLAKELEEAQQRLRDLERGQSLTTAIQRKEIEKLRIASKDLTKTNEERVDSLEQALKLEDFILQQQLKNQTERVRIAKLEFNRANSTAEDEQAFINEKIKLVDLETSSLRRQRTVITELESLKSQGRKKENKEKKKLTYEEFLRETEAYEKKRDAEIKKRETLAQQREKDNEDLQVFLDEEEQIVTDAEDIRLQKEFDAQAKRAQWAEEERLLDRDKITSKLMVLDAVIGLSDRETAIGKALIVIKQLMLAKQLQMDIKETISNARKTVTKASLDAAETGTSVAKGTAKAASTLNPIVIAGWAVTAIGVVSSMVSAFKKSKSVASKFGSGGGAGPNISAPKTPQAPSFNIVGASVDNQLETAVGSQNSTPIQAYVVSNAVTTAQELDRNIIEGASL